MHAVAKRSLFAFCSTEKGQKMYGLLSLRSKDTISTDTFQKHAWELLRTCPFLCCHQTDPFNIFTAKDFTPAPALCKICLE